MNAQPNINTGNTKKHTVSFVLGFLAMIVVMYLVSLAFRPANASAALEFNFFLVVLVLLIVWAVFGFILNFGWFALVFHMNPIAEFKTMLNTKHESGRENMSRAYLVAGLYMIAAQIVGFSFASPAHVFVYNFLSLGSVALFAAGVVTCGLAGLFGIGSAEAFKAYYDNRGNNQMVLLIMVLANLAVFVPMIVHVIMMITHTVA